MTSSLSLIAFSLSLSCIFLSSLSLAAECGKFLSQVPENLFEISSGKVDSGSVVSRDVLASRRLVIRLDGDYRLFNVAVTAVKSNRIYCTSGGVVKPVSIIDVTEAPLGSNHTVRIGNIGSEGEKTLSFYIYGDLNPDWGIDQSNLIKLPLFVFIFDNAPEKENAKNSVDEALRIWRKIGIDFRPTYKIFTGEKVSEVLGSDMKLQGFFSEMDTDVGEWQDRERIQFLKPHKDSIAVVFAPTTHGTRTDPYRQQVYIDYDVPGAPVGRTVAHEIGHLLLGEGHTGNQGVPWTSGLMIRGDGSNATDISDDDAKTARERARKIPR